MGSPAAETCFEPWCTPYLAGIYLRREKRERGMTIAVRTAYNRPQHSHTSTRLYSSCLYNHKKNITFLLLLHLLECKPLPCNNSNVLCKRIQCLTIEWTEVRRGEGGGVGSSHAYMFNYNLLCHSCGLDRAAFLIQSGLKSKRVN